VAEALSVCQIVPFTGQRAQSCNIIGGSFRDQKVRQIVEAMCALPVAGNDFSATALGKLHFDADFTANVA
jgi:hypothetical protein